METQPQVSFRRYMTSETVRGEIDRQIERLKSLGPRLTSCRVVVSGPSDRRRNGGVYDVAMRIGVVGQNDIAVSKSFPQPGDEYALTAVRHAFAMAYRQLADSRPERRHGVEDEEIHGRISAFIAGEDGGFITTDDGHQVYFHRDALKNASLDALRVGDRVRLRSEEGHDGPQATFVFVAK